MKLLLASLLLTVPAHAATQVVSHCTATVVASEHPHLRPPVGAKVSMDVGIEDQQPLYTELVFSGTGGYTGQTVFGIFPGQDRIHTTFQTQDGVLTGTSCHKDLLLCTRIGELTYDNRALTGTLVDYVRSCEPQESCPTEKTTFSLRCDAAIRFPN